MRIFVTGATGYIGAAVSEALARAGHEVVGLARSDGAERSLAGAGHEPVRGDLRTPDSLTRPATETDAVVHVGNTGEEDAGEVDRAAVEALLDVLVGTGKPLIYTSGAWVLGDTGDEVAGEDASLQPVDLVAWRAELEPRILDAAERDVASVVVRPAIVYGRGGGLPAMFVDQASDSGSVRVVGDGRQLWPMVHVDELADLYVRCLDADRGSLYHAASGPSYQARDLAVAASVAAGTRAEVESWPLVEARRELGPVAEALALSQRMSGRTARRELGWNPESPSVLEEILRGSYVRGG